MSLMNEELQSATIVTITELQKEEEIIVEDTEEEEYLRERKCLKEKRYPKEKEESKMILNLPLKNKEGNLPFYTLSFYNTTIL